MVFPKVKIIIFAKKNIQCAVSCSLFTSNSLDENNEPMSKHNEFERDKDESEKIFFIFTIQMDKLKHSLKKNMIKINDKLNNKFVFKCYCR